jgi:hypothetical protein
VYDYDPEKDDWTHRVTPRRFHDEPITDRDVCVNGREHEYASGECVNCEMPDPYQDSPLIIHAYDTQDDHIHFAGCRHARTPEGRYLRDVPDFDSIEREE